MQAVYYTGPIKNRLSLPKDAEILVGFAVKSLSRPDNKVGLIEAV